MAEAELNLGDFENVQGLELDGMTQDDVTDVADMVFYFENHEGPLDVLWRLVRSTKLDIADVHISDITSQYLEYVRSLTNMDMESMSWFIREAARLLEVKSNSLLPKPEQENDDETLDMEELYKRRMKMYMIFKETSLDLAACENVNRFYKEPEKSANDFRIVLKNMNMQNLVDAFSKLLLRVEKQAAPIIEKQVRKDRFTVRDSVSNIRSRLEICKSMRFSEIFASDFTKSEIITTFLALLELLKLQYVAVEQVDIYGEINITKKEGENKTNDEEIAEYN